MRTSSGMKVGVLPWSLLWSLRLFSTQLTLDGPCGRCVEMKNDVMRIDKNS